MKITRKGYYEVSDPQGNSVSQHTSRDECYEAITEHGQSGIYLIECPDREVEIVGSAPAPDPTPDPIPDPDPIPTPDPVPSGEWIGIPDPTFGIAESVEDTDFTHWVDNTHPNTGASGNGTPENPRSTLPTNLSEGDVVQVRGGPYPETALTFDGRASNPVFFRGPAGGKVVFQGREGLTFNGENFIVENVDIARIQSENNSYYAVRDSDIHEPVPGTGGMVGISDTDAVYLRNRIWGNGSVTDPKDRHGINIYGGERYWILDNIIHENGGDAIQFCHWCVNAGNGGPGAIYIGGNVMYGDKENAVDMKEFTGPVIISGNEMYGYRRITSGQGEAIRVNDEGNQGELWMIRNNIHDCQIGINPDDSKAESYAVDNILNNNGHGIIAGLTGQGGNVVDGVSDGSPEDLYNLFESRHGIDIRP